jgi:AraC family transcriptional regulator
MQPQPALDGGLFPGLGQMAAGTRGGALRLWRRCAGFTRNAVAVHRVERPRIDAVLRLLCAQQAQLRELVDRCPGRSLRRRRQVFARMQRAWLYMAGNLDRPVRIPELAGLGSVSVWYFTKTFQALYGEGPQAASTRLRLAHAARLLRGTRLSVSEAGEACGFENNCSFSRAFRARFGMPPSRYRLHGAGAPHAANRTGMHRQAVGPLAP